MPPKAKMKTAPTPMTIGAANAGTATTGQNLAKRWSSAALAEKASETMKLRLVSNHTRHSAVTNKEEHYWQVIPKQNVPALCEVLYKPTDEEIRLAKDEVEKSNDSRFLRFTRPYVRHMIYMAGADSVWLDETDIDLEYIKSNPPKGIMLYGEYVDVVKSDDPLKFEYLKNCSYNRNSPHRSNKHTPTFEEINVVKQTKDFNKKEGVKAKLLADVLTLLEDIEEDDKTGQQRLSKMLAIASTIRINGAQVVDLNGQAYEIQNNIRWLVSYHPELWLQAMSNPANLAYYVVKQALETQVLKYNAKTNAISWENGELIQAFTPSLDAEYELAALLVHNEPLYQEIRRQVQEVWDERVLGAPIPETTVLETLKPDDYYAQLYNKLN